MPKEITIHAKNDAISGVIYQSSVLFWGNAWESGCMFISSLISEGRRLNLALQEGKPSSIRRLPISPAIRNQVGKEESTDGRVLAIFAQHVNVWMDGGGGGVVGGGL